MVHYISLSLSLVHTETKNKQALQGQLDNMILDVKKKFSVHSQRVKCIDLHPTEPWMVVSLINGSVYVYNYVTNSDVKQISITSGKPIRSVKFIARKQWIVTACDDSKVRVYNYNTMENIKTWKAHGDYIRAIAVHPTLPYILTASDDHTIRLWDWENNWKSIRRFIGHESYVMSVTFNPIASNAFATASLDRTVRVWSLTCHRPHFTLRGHKCRLNVVAYYQSKDKPYLLSGADDNNIRLWDYQSKKCVMVLRGHSSSVTTIVAHDRLPFIISGSEDGEFRLWDQQTFNCVKVCDYNRGRIWSIGMKKDSTIIAVGYDMGSMIFKLSKETPVITMDHNGNVIWCGNNDTVFSARVSKSVKTTSDGLPVVLINERELSVSDITPQKIEYNSNGGFVSVSDRDQYIVYTSRGWRSRSFGQASGFAWSTEIQRYATQKGSKRILLYYGFKEEKMFKCDFEIKQLFSGALLGVKGDRFIQFYDWIYGKLICHINIDVKQVVWSSNGSQVSISSSKSAFILDYNSGRVCSVVENEAKISSDGISKAFTMRHEISERFKTGVWVDKCFIYTTSHSLNYCIGTHIETIVRLSDKAYILGYIPRYNRVFLSDRHSRVVAYKLNLALINYQTAVLENDFNKAEGNLKFMSEQEMNRTARFLDSNGYLCEALRISRDTEHRFDMAIRLGHRDIAYKEAIVINLPSKWKQLTDLALISGDFGMAIESMWKCKDYSSLLLVYTSRGDQSGLSRLGKVTLHQDIFNIAFSCFYTIGSHSECVDVLVRSGRYSLACMFSRVYIPSRLTALIDLWRSSTRHSRDALLLKQISDPIRHSELFPDYKESLRFCLSNNSRLNSSIASTEYYNDPTIIKCQNEYLIDSFNRIKSNQLSDKSNQQQQQQ